jgi:LmbE family N-acetylglucosaminyl deacetylase
MFKKNSLFVGAHPDDVAFSSTMLMKYLGVDNINMVTISRGAFEFSLNNYPVTLHDVKYYTLESFEEHRMSEEEKFVQKMGLDKRYYNAGLKDLTFGDNLDYLNNFLSELISVLKINSIITHEFPQAHPDHEVCSFISHYVANKMNIEVWEYPMYGVDDFGNFKFERLSDKKFIDFFELKLDANSRAEKMEIVQAYSTQSYYLKNMPFNKEVFFKIYRDKKSFDEYSKYIHDVSEKISPEYTRKKINEFIEVNS